MSPDPRDEQIADLICCVATLTSRVSELERRLPPPRWEPPQGWVTTKEAAFRSGYSSSTLYRQFRRGAIRRMRIGARVVIDPTTLRK